MERWRDGEIERERERKNTTSLLSWQANPTEPSHSGSGQIPKLADSYEVTLNPKLLNPKP